MNPSHLVDQAYSFYDGAVRSVVSRPSPAPEEESDHGHMEEDEGYEQVHRGAHSDISGGEVVSDDARSVGTDARSVSDVSPHSASG